MKSLLKYPGGKWRIAEWISDKEFYRTVFLTREEAEKALKGVVWK